ncbi:uncharacterized protein LOC135927855 isoform X1 [Gordionus sp. m RMFG-2023]|uniref:uncharacterized protein LOC135927855 isoform X1 n=1 Tax=Gordionus sp. m RMFG-2023 TaxID=3053472 RepID=UPI0031FC6BCD
MKTDLQLEIRCIKSEEINAMPKWIYKEVGWTNIDFTFLKLCYDLDPQGWFVAVTPKEGIIGSVLSVNLNHQYSFASVYIVSKNYRRRGIGKKLWNTMLGHVAHRCLGINSVKGRVFSNLKMGMTPPLFKISTFNGSLKRNSPMLRKFFKNPGNDKLSNLTPIPTIRTTCNHNQCNSNYRHDHECNMIDAKKLQSYRIIQTNLDTNYLIDDEIDIKETTRDWGHDSNQPTLLVDKLFLKVSFYNSLNTRSGDLARYNHEVKLPSKAISVVFMDGVDINLTTLRDYDTAIHGGLAREKLLKTFIQLSAENDLSYKVRCIVAIKRCSEMEICGYGIIRPGGISSTTLNNETFISLSTKNSTPISSEHYMIIGPLYADCPKIAHTLLNALLNSIPAEWEINVELTVPLKMEPKAIDTLNILDLNFLYMAATKELELIKEDDYYRMYQNNILETLNGFQENVKESKPIGSNIEKNNVDEKRKCIPIPKILMEKVYSFVSSDMFLD